MNTGRIVVLATLAGVCASGCAFLPDTTLGHKCGVPTGIECMTMQEVYDRTVTGDLPGLIPGGNERPPKDLNLNAPQTMDTAIRASHINALYAPPQELRIWVNRWRDTDGDLHDDSFMYVLVGEGQWLVRD